MGLPILQLLIASLPVPPAPLKLRHYGALQMYYYYYYYYYLLFVSAGYLMSLTAKICVVNSPVINQ